MENRGGIYTFNNNKKKMEKAKETGGIPPG